MKILELNERGEVRITKHGLAIPEFKDLKELDHTSGKEYFANQITYIYFVYDKESSYFKIIPLRDRQKMVLSDKLKGCTLKEFEGSQKVFDCINKYQFLEMTVNERVFNRCKLKFGEFQVLWSETPVSNENYKELNKAFDSVHDLFGKLEKLEKLVREEGKLEVKNYGNYVPTLLEEGVFD